MQVNFVECTYFWIANILESILGNTMQNVLIYLLLVI